MVDLGPPEVKGTKPGNRGLDLHSSGQCSQRPHWHPVDSDGNRRAGKGDGHLPPGATFDPTPKRAVRCGGGPDGSYSIGVGGRWGSVRGGGPVIIGAGILRGRGITGRPIRGRPQLRLGLVLDGMESLALLRSEAGSAFMADRAATALFGRANYECGSDGLVRAGCRQLLSKPVFVCFLAAASAHGRGRPASFHHFLDRQDFHLMLRCSQRRESAR